MKPRSIVPWIALSLMAGFTLGCGDTDLGQVSGKVTLDGKPLPDAMLIFTPLKGGRPAAARTDAQGNYELIYSREETGAMLGEHVVEITTGDELSNEDGTIEIIEETVPARYNSQTELRAVIESGDNEVNFTLESGGDVVQDPEAEG